MKENDGSAHLCKKTNNALFGVRQNSCIWAKSQKAHVNAYYLQGLQRYSQHTSCNDITQQNTLNM